MKNKKKIISLTAMSLVMGTTIATANAGSLRERFRDPVAVSEDIQAELEALKSGNYESWKAAVEKAGDSGILKTINEGNFAKYSEVYRLRASGDMKGAKAIMEELDIKGLGRGGGIPRKINLSVEDKDALELSVENADYDAWKTLMAKVPKDMISGYLTEEKFSIIVRAYKLQASGDRSGAKTLLDDSDIPGFMLMFGDKAMRGGREGKMDMPDEGNRQALMNTYKSGDFAAWKTLIEERGGGKILELVNAGNFAQFAQAKILQSEDKMSEAKEILNGLGFPFQERGDKAMRNNSFAPANAN